MDRLWSITSSWVGNGRSRQWTRILGERGGYRMLLTIRVSRGVERRRRTQRKNLQLTFQYVLSLDIIFPIENPNFQCIFKVIRGWGSFQPHPSTVNLSIRKEIVGWCLGPGNFTTSCPLLVAPPRGVSMDGWGYTNPTLLLVVLPLTLSIKNFELKF